MEVVPVKFGLLATFSLRRALRDLHDRTGKISDFFLKYPIFIGFQREVTSFLLSPGTLRGHYGPCESSTTFQCQVVENETVAQTDRSLELPPVGWHSN